MYMIGEYLEKGRKTSFKLCVSLFFSTSSLKKKSGRGRKISKIKPSEMKQVRVAAGSHSQVLTF